MSAVLGMETMKQRPASRRVLAIAFLVGMAFAASARAEKDLKARLPRVPPKEPAASMETFRTLPGFRIEQVAAEPLVFDPVDMAFDENGRMYVAEYIGYSENDAHKPGRIALLEDTNNDGRFDKRTVFAEGLSWNATVTCFDGGVFVGASPDLLYLKDTDGDGKADVREVVLTGFGLSNVNQLLNSLRWRLDNRIHAVVAASGGNLRAVRWERTHPEQRGTVIPVHRRDISFHPRTGQLRLESSGDQHGMGLDQWGRKFGSANGNHCQMVMYEDRYIARNPYVRAPTAHVNISVDGKLPPNYRTSPREPWRIVWAQRKLGTKGPEWVKTRVGVFSAACGITVYTGNAWPSQYRGNLFIAEPSGNLVHRKRLEPSGVGFLAYRTEQKCEFLTSNENWFRPVQFTNAPDGTLYVADMYREVIEHPSTFPDDIKALLDLNSGNDRGRIYRIVPDGFRQPDPPRLGSLSTVELVGLLEHPNGWHRRTASRLLYERQDKRCVEPLRKLAMGGASPLVRMHAMYALDGQDALTSDIVLARLDDPHPRVREHAVRLSERVLADSSKVRQKLCAMVTDGDMRVRYQLAFTLGEIPGSEATAALAVLFARDGSDSWMRLAVLSSSLGRAGDLFSRLVANRQWAATETARASLVELTEQIGRQNRPGQPEKVLDWLNQSAASAGRLALDVVAGLAKTNLPMRRRLTSQADTPAGRLLAEVVRNARRLATDDGRSVGVRMKAIGALVIVPFDDARDVLGALLHGRQPQAVQRESLRVLGRFRDARVAEMIVAGWADFSPQVQRTATEVLFARPERLSVLLAAIKRRQVNRSQLDPARIQLLLAHPDETIRSRAKQLLGGDMAAGRGKVVADYRESLNMPGDAGRGKAVFKRVCSTCHRLEGVGYDLGLPLAGIKDRGAKTILLAVFDPNREVQPQYFNYVVVTNEGLSVTGMIGSETATSITLKRADGESDTVLRVDIDELHNTGVSIMPEGLEKQLTKQDTADVIAYLMSVESL